MNFDQCREKIKNKIISVKENSRVFIIHNNAEIEVSKVTVDGCLMNESQQKCDYLFEIDLKNEVIYVELKGENIQKAYDQLVSTIIFCESEHREKSKVCFIIASRVPKAGPQIQVLKKKMLQSLSTQLFVSTNRGTVKIS